MPWWSEWARIVKMNPEFITLLISVMISGFIPSFRACLDRRENDKNLSFKSPNIGFMVSTWNPSIARISLIEVPIMKDQLYLKYWNKYFFWIYSFWQVLKLHFHKILTHRVIFDRRQQRKGCSFHGWLLANYPKWKSVNHRGSEIQQHLKSWLKK